MPNVGLPISSPIPALRPTRRTHGERERATPPDRVSNGEVPLVDLVGRLSTLPRPGRPRALTSAGRPPGVGHHGAIGATDELPPAPDHRFTLRERLRGYQAAHRPQPVAAPLPARLAGDGRGRRRHRRGADDPLRPRLRRGGRAPSGLRALRSHGAHGGVRARGLVAPPGARARRGLRCDDRRHAGTPRRRQPGARRGPGPGAGSPRGRAVPGVRAGPRRLPRQLLVPAAAERLHDRAGHHHPGRPAAQAPRHQRGRRRHHPEAGRDHPGAGRHRAVVAGAGRHHGRVCPW